MDIQKLADEIFKTPARKGPSRRARARVERDFVADEDAHDELNWKLVVDGAIVGYHFGTKRSARREAREVEAELGLLSGTIEVSFQG